MENGFDFNGIDERPFVAGYDLDSHTGWCDILKQNFLS